MSEIPRVGAGDQSRAERLWQAAVVILLVLMVVALIRVVSLATDDSGPYEPIPESATAYSVIEAIAVAGTDQIAVAGYVFDGDGRELRLCATREPLDPPRCVGPFLSLKNVNRGNFVVERGEGPFGRVWWSPGVVTVAGVIFGTEFTVTDILSD